MALIPIPAEIDFERKKIRQEISSELISAEEKVLQSTAEKLQNYVQGNDKDSLEDIASLAKNLHRCSLAVAKIRNRAISKKSGLHRRS